MLFWKFHIVKYPEQNLKEIFPPVRLERVAVSLDDFKEHSKTSCTYIQLTTTYYTRQLKQQGEPSPYPHSIFLLDIDVFHVVFTKKLDTRFTVTVTSCLGQSHDQIYQKNSTELKDRPLDFGNT